MPAASIIERFETQEHSPVEDLVEALREVTVLDGLETCDYEWLARNGKECRVRAGEVTFRQDEPAEYMYILLRGEVQVRRVRGNETNVFTGRAGNISGIIPYSRMKNYGGDGIASSDLWLLAFHKSEFPSMLENVPAIRQRLISLLLDRVREVTRIEQQAEKLTSLNKLAGNLAHELNNPASAAQSSASHLLQELRTYGHQKFELGKLGLSQEQMQALRHWEEQSLHRAAEDRDSALQESDRQLELQSWLESRSIPAPDETAAMLAEQGLCPRDLDLLAQQLDANALGIYLAQFASSLRTRRMTEAILGSTGRIFEIINAIKDYSYLDQAPLQQVDIPRSLGNALAMLQSRLGRIEIVEKFPPDLPCITAFGSELNQVWTALLENAIDAMEEIGRLELSARPDNEWMLVEFRDNGTGIAPDITTRIFEPFFTTKPPGKGLGLGLDAAMRIVRKHRGAITVESVPGNTCFQVRLPIEQGGAY